MPFLTLWNFLKLTTIGGPVYSLWFHMFHEPANSTITCGDPDFTQPIETALLVNEK